MKKKTICLILALTLVLSIAASAQAITANDTAGNVFCDDALMNAPVVENDLYWMGETLTLSSADIANDVIIAGNTLNVSQAKVGGSLRAAGYTLNISGVQAENNMTCAGYAIGFDSACSARGVYGIGASIVFDGTAESAYLAGSTVTLNGRVSGDATVIADHVEIGPNAKIDGKLKVQASSEPSIPSTASVADYEFSLSAVDIEETSQAAIAAAAAAKTTSKLLSRVYWTFAMMIVALFFCLVMNGSLKDSALMVKARTAPMLVSGVVGVLAMPLLLLAICLTFIGLPLAGLLAGLFTLLILFAIPFAGSSLGRVAFPSMNVWLAALIGTAVLTALRIVPILKTLILWGSVMYTMGYFIQVAYRNILRLKEKPLPEIPVEPSSAPQISEETENEEK